MKTFFISLFLFSNISFADDQFVKKCVTQNSQTPEAASRPLCECIGAKLKGATKPVAAQIRQLLPKEKLSADARLWVNDVARGCMTEQMFDAPAKASVCALRVDGLDKAGKIVKNAYQEFTNAADVAACKVSCEEGFKKHQNIMLFDEDIKAKTGKCYSKGKDTGLKLKAN